MPTNPALIQQLLDALDQLSGLHPGFRPAHAKGLMCTGSFTPSPESAKLTRALHAAKPSTPVTVRYSDSTGVPTIPDNDPQRSGPRGIAIRFHLGEHVEADGDPARAGLLRDRKSTRLNSSHVAISYAVFCLEKKKKKHTHQ